MPGKKRGRGEDEGEEGEEEGEEEQEEQEGPQCGNGHPMVKVPREVRRLEKELTWSCDQTRCRSKGEEGHFPDRARYRCVHYGNGGKCNKDLCGPCVEVEEGASPKEPSVRKSGREARPSALRAGEEWEVGPGVDARSPQGKARRLASSSPTKAEISPGRAGRRSLPRTRSESQETPLSAGERRGRSSRPTPEGVESPRGRGEDRKEGSPRKDERRGRGRPRRQDTDDSEGTGEDTPFYPAPGHVHFSPSVKTKSSSSPYGKTRSGRRGLGSGSYIQSLPSEDEQTAFNKQYSRDLRKRQKRRASEEEKEGGGGVERRSSRREVTTSGGGERRSSRRARTESESGGEELSLAARKKNLRAARKVEEEVEEDEEEEGAGDPTVTEASVRRSSRRRLRSGGETEGDADTESAVEKDEEEEEETEEDETPIVRRSSRRRVIAASSEEEEPEEEETPEPRRGRPPGKRKTEVEDLKGSRSEDEEEEEEGEEVRRSSKRSRMPVDRYKPDAPEESSSESEEERVKSRENRGRRKNSPKKKYGLRDKKKSSIRRYTDEFPGTRDGVSSRDQGLIRRNAIGGRGGGRPSGKREKKRQRTGDSSSPSDSSESDEANFEMRKSKRMGLEREKMRPLNMDKRDVNKAVFKDRSKAGSSLADVQPMEMDMGVTFQSVGGLKEHVNALKEMVMFPLLYPELFQQFQIQPPRGVLFYGPPGTGKTLLARALACECSTENRKVAFFMRKGADCLSKWIGESERQLRLLFDQAYQMRPSIIFFDEIDGLAPVRSSRQDQIHSSIVSTLLALMDGLDSRGEVVLIGATNRLENIDPALRRPGRFDRELRFALPDRKTRKEILQLHTTAWQPPITPPLLATLATRTIGYCGADLKGLTAEAALNALRRVYPQVYESNKKLAIRVEEVAVTRPDFEKALRKIVCSTHRVEDKLLGPLPRHIRPLLQETVASLTHSVKRLFPHSAAGKGAVLPATLTHRPRLLVLASEGQGQRTYLAPALLHMMEAMPCQKLDIPALFSNSARSPEEAITQLIHTARRTQPGILYIPHLLTLWETVSETVRATLLTLLADLPPTAPLLILAVADCSYSHLPEQLQDMFVALYRETHRIENPGENERREYFRPLVTSCSAPPPKPAPPPAAREQLEVLPAPESRSLTAREEKRLRRKEETLLRELRIFLRDIWAKINRESKFFMFRSPVNTEDVDDYLQFVEDPMDLEKMHMKLDDGEYNCAQTFLNDIDLIAENAITYNCDLAYETNRIIVHRARALQDFAYALVKSEMDTDFEDNCRDIVARRKEAAARLKEIDKATPGFGRSPEKLQQMLAIVSTACQVCRSTGDEDAMLLCDGCDHGYHTHCHQPPITDVPDGDWFCPRCSSEDGVKPPPGGSEERRRAKRRRRNAWSSGVIKKKPAKKDNVKKKLLGSEDEEDGGEEEKKTESPKDKTKEVVEEEEKKIGKTKEVEEEEEPMEEAMSSPRSSRRAATHPPAIIAQIPSTSAAPEDLTPSEAPSVPTGVRIDASRVLQWYNDLVRTTEGCPVERLERVYTAMAKVIRTYRQATDRTALPTDLMAELEVVKTQERERRGEVGQNRARQRI